MAEIGKKDILEALREFSERALDPKFERIEQHFEGVDHRLQKTDERTSGLDQKVVEFKEEIVQQFHVISEDVISQVKLVAEGVMNLHEKLTREMGQLRRENDEAHQEIKAMIKFSYAELDRRISTLEGELKELKHRVDQIERRSIS